jgi:hypothetical protein
MPRGVRPSADTQIAEIEAKKTQLQAKIDGYKVKIAELDSQIKELKESKKQKELESLLEVIKASGKSTEEIKALVNS